MSCEADYDVSPMESNMPVVGAECGPDTNQ
jgi:hypothetical protein